MRHNVRGSCFGIARKQSCHAETSLVLVHLKRCLSYTSKTSAREHAAQLQAVPRYPGSRFSSRQ
eukprot:1149062-Pelagomonas_calceolata.AAC.8